jgi:hypothetical protein
MPKWNGEGVRNITMPVEAVEPIYVAYAKTLREL